MENKINIPAYKMVYNDIKEKIENNSYKVSRTTIRKAINLLIKDNFIFVKQGYGTEIINNKISQNLNSVTSVSKSLVNMGYEVEVKYI